MKVRKGLIGGQYKPITDQEIRKIHETSLRVFEEVGVQVNLPEALELFDEAGAQVDHARRLIKVPPDLVQACIRRAPPVVRLCGREENGELDCEIGGKKVYLGTGGTALNVQDPGSQDARRAVLEDVMNMARLVDALDNIHFYMLNVYPDDLPEDEVDVNRFGAALNRTRKHVMGGVYTVEGVRNVIKMAEIIAASQMAHFYQLPIYVTAGMSDSKLNDAQAGYESAITSPMVALAGGNYIHDAAGFLEFCMTASYDKLVIDNEIIGMVMRAVEGIRVDDETLAFDLIKKVGAGGHFVSERHTRRHMRSELYLPQHSDRENRDKWLSEGSKDARARATEKVMEILEAPPQSVLPENVRNRLKEEIPGLSPLIME